MKKTREPRRKIAVVLFNLGGPDNPKAVVPFLFNLFRDPAIIRLPATVRLPLAALIAVTRGKSARANYERMGGASPLPQETDRQARALEASLANALPGDEIKVFVAMRYWKPMSDVVAGLVALFAPDELVLLPLYPQFSTTTTGSSLEAWNKAYKGTGTSHTVCCYPDVADFARAHAVMIRQSWEKAGKPDGLRLLFSAHGLPQSIVDSGDPYEMQVQKTCAAVIEQLGPNGLGQNWDWRICYQSRVGRLKWLGPYAEQALKTAAEDGRGVIITPIAFVSEHVETLVEMDHEYALLAERVGVQSYVRVPALSIDTDFINALTQAATKALEKTGICPAGSGCGNSWKGCPCRRDVAA